MSYEIFRDGILVRSDDFDPVHTLECGQVFRYYRDDDGYRVISGRRTAKVVAHDGGYRIVTEEPDYFVRYFDLDTDYSVIKSSLHDGGIMDEAISFGKGIRILRQELYETVFSFIISANNHIPRIKGIIERISNDLGEDMGGYRAFPTVERLCVGADYYKSIGAGYRADYLATTARAVADGALEGIEILDTASAGERLLSLKGVGRKVADCILLFGMARTDLFPVDTWIKKVHRDYFGGEGDARRYLIGRFGELSGYAQQYLFYYKRELEKIKDKPGGLLL